MRIKDRKFKLIKEVVDGQTLEVVAKKNFISVTYVSRTIREAWDLLAPPNLKRQFEEGMYCNLVAYLRAHGKYFLAYLQEDPFSASADRILVLHVSDPIKKKKQIVEILKESFVNQRPI